MVKLKEEFHPHDGPIDLATWIQHAAAKRSPPDVALFQQAASLLQLSAHETKTISNDTVLQYGLATADILLHLQLDTETIIAGLIFPTVQYTDLSLEDVTEQLGKPIAKLVEGVQRMGAMHNFRGVRKSSSQSQIQVDNIRKMLLAMVDDVRVVLIKLAERTTLMQHLSQLEGSKQREIAQETQDIYAPLANRLGMGQLKWMLEDLAFRYLEPETYREIASLVDQKRLERESYIQKIIQELKVALHKSEIHEFDIQGRAKHIYSIYKKMQRKGGDFRKLYDIIAFRVQVPDLENCYAVLGIVHSLWKPIPEEFDDYITRPKPNGYRSIHTAVAGPDERTFEVQIRTYAMHQEAELGVAAHWVYKEGGRALTSYDQKIAWLRQVIEWQKEVAAKPNNINKPEVQVFEDTVYVFTPTGEIIDLSQGSTPLDFAYTIHTEVGHRCRGAKVNGHIVPLTYILKTGDQVEILTAKYPAPSRDWINPVLGYLKTSRAKAKVHHWLKLQDYEKNIADGRDLFEREVKRLGLTPPTLEALTKKFNYKSAQDMFAALGAGDLRVAQLLHAPEAPPELSEEEKWQTLLTKSKITGKVSKGINIQGIDNLLNHLANCCKPVPGDAIIGFITHGRGVSIHREDCVNITHLPAEQKERLLSVNWGEQEGIYPVDIFIEANDRQGLIRDITTLISNEKINVVSLNTITDQEDHHAKMVLTLEITNLSLLNKILERVQQMPDVVNVERLKAGG